MFRKILFTFFFILFFQNILAYNYEFKTDQSSIILKFDGSQISEIKFEFVENNQKNFGIIKYNNEEIDISLNTNIIEFDEFKKFFPKLKNKN